MSDNCCNNGGLGIDSPTIYMFAILSIFGGGGFGPNSFWGAYNNAFRCSTFNNPKCSSMGSNMNNNNSLNNSSYINNGNSLNANSSNMDLASLFAGFSGILADGAIAGLSSENTTGIDGLSNPLD